MSLIDFKSDGIEYRLILYAHGFGIKESLDGIDALVVETGPTDQRDFANSLTKPELADYLTEIRKNGAPIYSVDNKGRDFLLNDATSLAHMYIPPIMAYGVSKLVGADVNAALIIALCTTAGELASMALPSFLGNGTSKFFAKINSYFSMLRQAPREELRNALLARKIKKGVLPHLRENYADRFTDRAPRIGIIYGSAHSGIKECLKSDLRAGVSLGLHKYYGLRFVLDRHTLNDCSVYSLNENGSVGFQRFQVESI